MKARRERCHDFSGFPPEAEKLHLSKSVPQAAGRTLIHVLHFTADPPGGDLSDEAKRKQCEGIFIPVTEENIQDCAAFEDAAHYVPVYREMLCRGDLVLFGYLDGACVFRCCLQRSGPILYRERVARELAVNEAYVHYVFCAPAARRKGFHEAALRYLHSTCPDHDLYAQVDEDNIPSLRGFYRIGFHPASASRSKRDFFTAA